MKKIILLMVVAVASLVGCDKDKGGGGNNNRYNDYYGNGGYGNGFGNDAFCQGGRGMRYEEFNGRCVDTRNNRDVNFNNCERESYEFERRCGGSGMGFGNRFGNNRFGGGGRFGGGRFGNFGGGGIINNMCATTYGIGWVTIYTPNTGFRGCVQQAVIGGYVSNYSIGYWNNIPGVYQGCLPGQPGCFNWGGTLGVGLWVGAGFRF
jgi:hypothetical protein